ncbi:MAG: CD225/dispanin family protein [Thermoguttaceae bacterium]
MFCTKCGLQLSNQTTICPKCWSPVPPQPVDVMFRGPQQHFPLTQHSPSTQYSPPIPQSVFPPLPFSGPVIPRLPDYTVWGILESFFCVPFGVLVIVYSLQTKTAKEQGQYQEALRLVKKTEMYLLLGLIGIIAQFVYPVLCLLLIRLTV